MILEELRLLMRAQPFQPFSIFTGDGQEIAVQHHDYAWLTPSGFQIHVESPHGRINLITVSQITRVSYAEKAEPANPTGGERP